MDDWPTIGDAVEVKSFEHEGFKPPREVWKPATCCGVHRWGFSVAFADGRRMAMARMDGNHRRPAPE